MSLAYTFREFLAKKRIENIEKFNPYHGPDGRFTTGSGATSFTIRTRDASKQGIVGRAVANEAANSIRNKDHEESYILDSDGHMRKYTVGDEGSVIMTVGEKRENAPGAVMMHNHPSGGTFSSADLHDLGYRPTEMWAVTTDGDYVMRSIDQTKTPDWVGLRDALESAEASFKEPYQLRNEIFEQKYRQSYDSEVNSIADRWIKERESGASKETLDAIYKEWQDAEAAWLKKHPKKEREAEAERAYLNQWHEFYQEHAAEHGIEYEFRPHVKKFNQNHGPDGRFTTGSNGSSSAERPKRGHVENLEDIGIENPSTFDMDTNPYGSSYTDKEVLLMHDTGCSEEKAYEYLDAVAGYTYGDSYNIRAAQQLIAEKGEEEGREIIERAYQVTGNEMYIDMMHKGDVLEEIIEKAPQFEGGVLYRGINTVDVLGNDMPITSLQDLKVGDIIDMGGTSSWSDSEDVSEWFKREYDSEGTGIMFATDAIGKATSIAFYSYYPEQREVIASKDNKYRVDKIEDGLIWVSAVGAESHLSITAELDMMGNFWEDDVKKFNQNHDERGRFTYGDGTSDAKYMEAAKRGDVETCRKMLEEKAKKLASDGTYAKETATYKLREGDEPQKTIKVYKTFYVDENGNPSTLFVEGEAPLPVGVWMDAKDAYHFSNPSNGKEYTPSRVNPNAEKGKGATGASVPIPNEEVRQELVDRGYLPDGSTAKNVTALAYRPGWHAGDLPFFPQGGSQDPVYAAEEKAYAQLAKDLKNEYGVSDGKAKKMREEIYGTFEQWRPQDSIENHPYKNLHEARQVVFECELIADHDYTSTEPIKSGENKGRTRFQDMQEMPSDGSYKFSTNPMANAQDLGAWYIGGSLRIVRPLSQQECDSMLKANGRAPQAWTTGEMSLEDLGVNRANSLEPIVYDDHGNIIPLSERFKAPVKKSATPTGCGVLVVNGRGEVLCGKRIERTSRGQICGPGGHIEDGETAEQAAIREAREEFGIECRNLKRLGTQNGGAHGVSAVFLCTEFSGTPKTDEEEMTKPRWANPGELTDNLFPPFEQSLRLLPNIEKHNDHHDPKTGRFTFSPFKGVKDALNTVPGNISYSSHGDSPFGDIDATGKTDSSKQERRESRTAEARMTEGDGELVRVGEKNTRGHVKLDERWHDMNDFERAALAREQIKEELGCSDEEAQTYATAIKGFTGTAYKEIRAQQRGELDGVRERMIEPTANALNEYIDRAPTWDGGPIYRGVTAEEKTSFYGNVQVGDVVDMGGISSWTSETTVADKFSGDGGAVFVVDRPTKGTSISHLSRIPHEGEVIVGDDVHYRVTSVEEKDGVTVYHVAQCKLPVTKSKTFAEVLIEKINHNHYPAGSPKGGQFAPNGGSGGISTGSSHGNASDGNSNGTASYEELKRISSEKWKRVQQLHREKGHTYGEIQRAEQEYLDALRAADAARPKETLEALSEKATRDNFFIDDFDYRALNEGMRSMADEVGWNDISDEDKHLMIHHIEDDGHYTAFGYFYSSNSIEINKTLRDAPDDDPFKGLRPEDVETCKTLDKHMAPTPETIHLGRMMDKAFLEHFGLSEVAKRIGSEEDISGLEKELSDAMVGKLFVNKGYTSTSYDLKENKWGGMPVRLRIKAPKGTPMLMSPCRGSGNVPKHAEMLLARGTALKITGVEVVEFYGRASQVNVICEVVLE